MLFHKAEEWLALGALLMSLSPVAAQQGAYFVLEGGGMPLVIERMDPILSPGQVSNHVHSIVGANSFQSVMDFAQTQKATCSTVSPKADKSVYWMPNLYYHDPRNGSFIRVPEQPYHKIYYKYGQGDNTYDKDITEFPQEFRMIAGNMFYRSENDTFMGPYGTELGWACHGGDGYPDFNSVGIPKGFTRCPNGLAASITMPSCWNGQPFDIKNPSAHMAYPIADGLVGCLAPYNVKRFPQIFVEYWLNIESFNGLYTANDSPFVLSMGDPTGFGFHVDFLNGWEVGALNQIMPTCKPGNTGNPPLNDPSCFGNLGGTYTYPEMDACTVPPTVNEDVGWTYGEVDNANGLSYGGVLSKLPGCNPIQYGPGMASIQQCSGSSPSSAPTTMVTKTSTAASSPTGAPQGWKFLGCYTDNVSGRTLNYGIPAPGGASTMTVEICLSGCHSLGYTYAGVEYAGECYCGNAIGNGGGPAPDGNAGCNMQCNGNSAETCGGSNRLDVYSYGS